MEGKTVSHSAVDDNVYVVFPNDLNAYGTLFGGRALELADRLAAIVAKRHSGHVCVTLIIDSVRFLSPAKHGELLVFQAAVNRAWGTSMEIGIKVSAEDFKTGQRRHIVSAYFTFVALDDHLKPTAVPPVIPQTPAEKKRYEEEEIRRQRRLTAR